MKSLRLLWIPALFILVALLSLAHAQRLAAQSNSSISGTGSISGNGTIPSSAVYLPLVANQAAPTPAPTYAAIPIAGAPIDRPAHIHGDLNLSLRSYVSTTAELTLVDIEGHTDVNAPQLADIFTPARLPQFSAVYQVHDWDWGCDSDGCRGAPLTDPAVTLLEMATSVGEAIAIPSRDPQIYGGGYKAMVLYAEATRITLVYTRDDTPAHGYVVHFEDFAVEPALLALYQQLNEAGRQQLPALHNGEKIGAATGATIKVAVRDTGKFMDPRSRKDWWVGFVR